MHRPVISNTSWELEAGVLVALASHGPGGKATMLRLLSRNLVPTNGFVRRPVAPKIAPNIAPIVSLVHSLSILIQSRCAADYMLIYSPNAGPQNGCMDPSQVLGLGVKYRVQAFGN